MTFREYLTTCDFEEIWSFLKKNFKEAVDTKPFYERLYNTIKDLPTSDNGEAIVMSQYGDGDWELTNILDPHSELIDREVIIKPAYRKRRPKDVVIAAHLLFWSSMYGLETAKQYRKSCFEGLRKDKDGPFYTMNPDSLESSSHIRKWLFFVPSLSLFVSLFDATEFSRWKDSENGFEEMKTSMNRVLTESGVAEVSKRTYAEIVVFLPQEWKELYPELENAIADLPMETRLTKWYGDAKDINEIIGQCGLRKYVPYVIVAAGETFDERHKEYLLHPNTEGCLAPEEIEKAVASLNRFDDYTYEDFYPNRDAEEKEKERIGKIVDASVENKRQHYWKRTILSDYPYDYTANLLILKKKLEYNIGYWKFVYQFQRTDYDISRMQTACRLCEIVTKERHDIKPMRVNFSNVTRYTKKHRLTFAPEDGDIYLSEIYQLKAYTILWLFLDHNMRGWWNMK